MTDGTSCGDVSLNIGGVEYQPIRWGEERGYRIGEPAYRCGDCGTPRGGVHHHGCDLEQCPACLSQALMCGCFDDLAPMPEAVSRQRNPNQNKNQNPNTETHSEEARSPTRPV